MPPPNLVLPKAKNMPTSDNIRYRAIGLLSSFADHCLQHGLTATKQPLPTGQTYPGNESERLVGNDMNLAAMKDVMEPIGLPADSDPAPTPTEPTAQPAPTYNPGSSDDELVSMEALLTYLNQRFGGKDVSLTTAKCYRRWLASYFEAIGHTEAAVIRNWIPPSSPEAGLAKDAEDANYLAAKSFDPSRADLLPGDESLPGNTRYLSFIDSASLNLLFEQLLSETRGGKLRYQSGPDAALMFMVSMMTGLRPNEWPTARYLESFFDPDTKVTLGPVLEVRTLKQTSRREDNPLREKRYLVLDRWPTDQLQRVESLVAHVSAMGDEFENFYNRSRMTLTRAWKRAKREALKGYRLDGTAPADASETALVASNALPDAKDAPLDASSMILVTDSRSVSFYTARHIFAEEIRRSVSLTRFELAALLGHSLLTNQVYYGPRMDKSDREYDFVLPRPWPGDADEIKLWDYKVNPLRTAYMQGDLFGGMPNDSALLGNDTPEDGVEGFYLR